MLDLKALLLKLMQFLGSDVVIQHPLNMSLNETTSREPTRTTLNDILSSTDDVMNGYNNLSSNSGINITARTTKVGRCLDDTNAEWAWKVTDLAGISSSTSKAVPITIYPLQAYNSFDAVVSSWDVDPDDDWELVELWAKFPQRTYTAKAGLQEEYCGYRTNTPSGTSTSVLFSSSYWEYNWPMPASFFNGIIPPLAIAGLMQGTNAATTRIGFRPLSDTQYRFRLYSHIHKITSSSSSYTYNAFVYTFFTRHRPSNTTSATCSVSGSNILMTTDPAMVGKTVYYYNNWNGPEGTPKWNRISTVTTSSSGTISTPITYQAGEKMLTNHPNWADQTGYPPSPYWYLVPGDTKTITIYN